MSSLCQLLQDVVGTHTDILENGLQQDEIGLLESFVCKFERDIKVSSAFGGIIEKLFLDLQTTRINSKWLTGASKHHRLSVLKCLRLLIRDDRLLQLLIMDKSSLTAVAQELNTTATVYLRSISGDDTEIVHQLLTELIRIVQMCSTSSIAQPVLINHAVHEQLAMFIEIADHNILYPALSSLVSFAKSQSHIESISDLYLSEQLVTTMLSPDTVSNKLASDLYLLLSQQICAKQQLKEMDLLPSLLTLVQGRDPYLQQRVIAALERLLEDGELLSEFRAAGGVSILISQLANGKKLFNEDKKVYLLLCAVCSLLTRLSVNDLCAVEIVKANGVYLLASFIVPSTQSVQPLPDNRTTLEQQVLRTLRFLFSLERNRKIFKKLFPSNILEMFINVGHYVYDLSHYHLLATAISNLPKHDADKFNQSIQALNQSNKPLHTIGRYNVLEWLGEGAYGSVYKVRVGDSGSFCAMKKVSAEQDKTTESSSTKTASEVAMTKEQLNHPNIVHYHKFFQEGDSLYIVMELLEGAPLSEHITSLSEKKSKFSEKRIWHIFIQLIQALQYLHNVKHIVHRDLKPANIMLGEADKLTITDFGLAKQKKKEFSVMNSTVGTILYWCPELVQNENYNEKADVWAAGCILYEMAALKSPFHSHNGNILLLATKIAEVSYEKLHGTYSPLVNQVIEQCLTHNKDDRPNTVQLGGLLASQLMQELDRLSHERDELNKKLSKERESRIRYLHEAAASEQKCKQLLAERRRVSSGDARKRLMYSSQSDDAVFPESPLTRGPVTDTPLHTQLSNKLSITEALQSRSSSTDSVPSMSTHLQGWASQEEIVVRRSRSSSLSPLPSSRRSLSGLLTLSSKNLREVVDPVGQLLLQVHKIVFLSKIPFTTGSSSPGLLIVRQYERALFGTSGQVKLLKSEMKKLSSCSNESVALLPPCPTLLSRALSEHCTNQCPVSSQRSPHTAAEQPTYEQLNAIIENLFQTHSNT